MPRIFVTGATLAEEARSLLLRHGCLCGFGNERDSSQEIAHQLAAFQPDGLIVRKGAIGEAVIAAAGSLKAISKHGVGVDNIDVAAATRRGIPVMITALANYESVAEHTLALMFAVSRRIVAQDRQVRRGIWDRQSYAGDDLCGKTLGLIGFGRIARRVAELVKPLAMRVLVFDPHAPSVEPFTRIDRLIELLAAADIVSIHCPLTSETRGLIGREEIASMKPGVLIVNTARGAIIEEAALAEALTQGHVAAAALDTFATEPARAGHPLFAMENVVVTAHVGGLSRNAMRNMGVGAVENILAVLDGRVPDRACLVNPEVFDNVAEAAR